MFIELTDHLRCPAPHPERFLVLLPDRMAGRHVLTGDLGCPACGRTWRLEDGILDFRPEGEERQDAGAQVALPAPVTAEAVQALLGLDGPGGFALTTGTAATLVPALTRILPEVGWVALNPFGGLPAADPPPSVLFAPPPPAGFPLKASCLRGAVVGPEVRDPAAIQGVAASVLPGLRVVGIGQDAELAEEAGLTLLGRSEGCWVARRGR